MSDFTIGSVLVQDEHRTVTFVGKPGRDSDETTGRAQLVKLTTPDGFIGTLGIVSWPDGEVDVRLLDYAQGGEAYERQKIAGTMNIKVDADRWVVRISALKINGKDWPTLNRVSWNDLDWLAGTDAQQLLTDHGATELGLYGDLVAGVGKRYHADLGMVVPAGEIEAIAALYAMTRTMAIMKAFGGQAVAGAVE